MVATRGRTFKRPWRRFCLSSKLKSSSAPIGRKDSWCFHAVGSSNAPLLGSTAAEGLPRIGRTSIATRWRSCGLPQSASCSENFVIPPDVFGQTLRVLNIATLTERDDQFSLFDLGFTLGADEGMPFAFALAGLRVAHVDYDGPMAGRALADVAFHLTSPFALAKIA